MAVSDMLAEHQATPSPDKSAQEVYEPTDEERKTIQLVERLLKKAKKHRAKYDSKWLDWWRMFRGRQWKEMRPSYRHSEVINLVFRTIQSQVPIQLDTRPKFEFLPQEPSDLPVSEILNKVAESDWTRQNWGEQLLEVVYDSNILGTGLSCMKGEPGKITYDSVDPFYCFPAPGARATNDECPYFCYAEPKDLWWVKSKYPDKAKFIRSDVDRLVRDEKDQDDIHFRSPADRNQVMEGSTPIDSTSKDMTVFKVLYLSPAYCAGEGWIDEEESAVLGEDGSPTLDQTTGQPQTEFVKRARYPKGRKICIASGVLLDDGENPYDDGEIPYSRYPNYVDPRCFWGISEVEQLAGPQRVFNKMVSFVLDVMVLCGNPVWLIPTSSGVDPDNLVNRPGLNIEFDGQNPPTRQEGTQLQPYILQMIDKMEDWFNSISGSQDVTRGVQPTGITAASAINTLQEAAQTRIRQKARNLDFYLQQVGQQYLSRVFQFYSTPQIVRLTGDQGASQYFRMHVEPLDDGTKKMTVTPYTDNGQEDVAATAEFGIRGAFDVKVATGSSLPFARAEKQGELEKLFQLGIIDAEEVLKGSDYPNYEAVLQRVDAKKQADAQAAAAAQPPPKGAPAPAA